MKLWDIVRSVGSGIIRNVVPGGGMIIDVVNELLPDDKKLAKDATGADIDTAVASLPPAEKARIMEKEFDVEITQIKESNETVRAMLESDAKTPHTTRPYIAKGSFLVVAFASIMTISIWAYGVIIQDKEIVKAIMEGWQFVLAVIGPLVTLLWAYFGVLKTEHKNKLNAASGLTEPSGLGGLISKLMDKKS